MCAVFLKKIPIIISITIIIVILVTNIYLSYNQLSFNTGNVPYMLWNMNIIEALIYRVFFSIICIVISICCLSLIPSKQNFGSYYGSKSLLLYVYHAVILYFLIQVFEYFRLSFNIYVAIAEFLVVVPFLLLISRLEFARIITAPISNIIKKRK